MEAVAKRRPSMVEEFLQDFPPAIKTIPDKGLFLALLAVWVLFFQFLGNSTFGYVNTHSIFAWAQYAYVRSIDDEHGRLIPFLVLFFFWWKRDDFKNVKARPWMPAIAIMVCAILLHLAGYFVQQTRISLAAFFLGLYGLIGLVWGPSVLKASFFPMCLFVFALPLGTLADVITFPLRLIATRGSTFVASDILGVNVLQRGTQIYDPSGSFQFEVAPACSGLRSLTAVLALCTIYGFLTFKGSWRRALLVVSAFPLAMAGNILRLLSIIVVSEAFGKKAGEMVHDSSFFSMVPYIPPIIGMLVLGHFLKPRPPKPLDGEKQTPGIPVEQGT